MEPKIVFGILINLIVWPFIIYIFWVTNKNEREIKRVNEELKSPENQFNRNLKKIGLSLSSFSDLFKYPYIIIPSFYEKEKAKIPKFLYDFENDLNLDYSNKEVKSGRNEYLLYDKLIEKLGDDKVSFGCYTLLGFYPDITYLDFEKKIFIDIEIDEPYSLKSKEPIHYFENKLTDAGQNFLDTNKIRDDVFAKNGWTIIRFSENQVVNYPHDCALIVEHVICYWSQKESNYNLQTSSLKFEPRWSLSDARMMAASNRR